MTVDLNCDMGEQTGVDEEALLPFFTSVNIACGGHAGDRQSMEQTVALARRHGVAIGAHPGYPDRANFGRLALDVPPRDIERFVHEQVAALGAIAPLVHVKPHGALYNLAARDAGAAESIARGVARFDGNLVLFGLAHSVMIGVWKALGFRVAAEAFADRRYESDGSLRQRKLAGALITAPAAAAAQAIRLVEAGASTLCIHSDTPGSLQIAAAVRERLERAGVSLRHTGWVNRPGPAPTTGPSGVRN